ncbi:hypothetical protein PISL3812_03984 [Talaromyces islandicus]|uniref:NAD-dependent epimerase/dehydratase domain-containing protein n=1 Tax=Talaromyces islandicus TaxID=28573 RepID=A0A0U1LWD2_TALIS|nr:hypothetical protein PISL3812_03984 [Talaromyces islandicus]
MPRILVFGATGYLGSKITGLLVQSGQHEVYGIARSNEKALDLARNEIKPVVCQDPANDPEPYLTTICTRSIDIVVDVSGANQESFGLLKTLKQVGQERLDLYQSCGVRGPKLGFIYCSGTWVHGSSNERVTDLDLVGSGAATPPEELVAWRVGLEHAVLNSNDSLDVMIIRPALIYGRASTIWSSFITPILDAAKNRDHSPIDIPLDQNSRPGLIHVDDAATAFQKGVEKLPLIAGAGVYPVFDLVTSQEGMREIFDSLAVAWGYEGALKLVGYGENLFAKAMSATFRGSSARAQLLLDWQPRRLRGFVKDMDIYAAAFAAHSS